MAVPALLVARHVLPPPWARRDGHALQCLWAQVEGRADAGAAGRRLGCRRCVGDGDRCHRSCSAGDWGPVAVCAVWYFRNGLPPCGAEREPDALQRVWDELEAPTAPGGDGRRGGCQRVSGAGCRRGCGGPCRRRRAGGGGPYAAVVPAQGQAAVELSAVWDEHYPLPPAWACREGDALQRVRASLEGPAKAGGTGGFSGGYHGCGRGARA